VFVAYFSRCFLSANRDVRIGASELFYKQGGYFSEVHGLLFFKHYILIKCTIQEPQLVLIDVISFNA
jgi:hypothetical protein